MPSTGTVALDTKRKAVQHLSGGIVKQVLVREGDEVQADQVLMRLDDAVAKSNYADVRQGYFALLATQGRLIAEQQGHPKVEFAPELLEAAKQDAQLQLQLQNQTQLFSARRAQLQADIQSLEEGVAGQRALQQSYKSIEQNRQAQLALLQQELTPLRELVQEGYAPPQSPARAGAPAGGYPLGLGRFARQCAAHHQQHCRVAAAHRVAPAGVPQRGGNAAGRGQPPGAGRE